MPRNILICCDGTGALCGILHIVGLLTEANEGLIPYAIRMIKGKHIDFRVAAMKS